MCDGEAKRYLANFAARIVAEVILDSFADRRAYEVEAVLGGRRYTMVVDAHRFDALTWVARQLPATAIVDPKAPRPLVAAAIRSLSGDVPVRRRFMTTGWRQLDGRWVFVHAGGAIGAEGADTSVDVDLPTALRDFSFPVPLPSDDIRGSLLASMRLIDLARDGKLAVALAAVYGAVLGASGFAVFLVGRTNVHKTECASLLQRHFGAAMTPGRLPCSWSSTAAGVLALAEAARDVVLVVDDLVTANGPEAARKADAILRGAVNRTPRQRSASSGGLGSATAPQAIVIATGEEMPPGHSLGSRLLVVDLAPGDVEPDALTACQRDAAAGEYARAMAACIQWLAPRMPDVRQRMREEADVQRAALIHEVPLRRTANALAELLATVRIVAAFAHEAGGLTPAEADDLAERWSTAIRAAAQQPTDEPARDPAHAFVAALAQAFACGRAHLLGMGGDCPADAERWGWERDQGTWQMQPRGQCIGFVDNDGDLLLLPNVAHRLARQLVAADGAPLVSPSTLWRRLGEAGFLVSTELGSHGTRQIRRTIHGQRLYLVHLLRSAFGVDAPPDPARQTDTKAMQVPPLISAIAANLGFEPATVEEAAE